MGCGLIESCLGRAIGELQPDPVVDPADRDLAVDHYTLDGPMAAALHEQFDILWQAAGRADGSPSFG